MYLKEQIANFFTLMNLVCGVMAIATIVWYPWQTLELACLFVFAGSFFDFLDGFVARALKISSDIGKQLDSLCDMVTFGIVPGLISGVLLSFTLSSSSIYSYLMLIPMAIPVFSALRLAKFNVDTRQSKDFIGIPTPANAFFWVSLYLSIYALDGIGKWGLSSLLSTAIIKLFSNTAFVICSILVSSVMMVVPIRLFGLKFEKFVLRGNEIRVAFIIVAVSLFIIFGFSGICLSILLYILFSIIHFYILKRHEVQS